MALPISVQLYSIREYCEKDFIGSLKRIADIGFKAVEPAGFWNIRPSELKKIETSLIYMEENDDGNPLHQISLQAGETKAHKLIRQLIKSNKFFFDHNDTGEFINNWLKFALTNTIVKG